MRSLRLLLLSCLCAAIAPVLSGDRANAVDAAQIPAWPTHFQGRMLSPVPLSEREQVFLSGFPGAVARFTDGERDVVMRWVTQPTRKLHPAEDCYRGLGYEIAQSRIVSDDERTHWRCFTATSSSGNRAVCEQLQDREGRRWTDVSSWFWAAALRRSEGPWLVVTVAAHER
jgi:hypothetical protein